MDWIGLGLQKWTHVQLCIEDGRKARDRGRHGWSLNVIFFGLLLVYIQYRPNCYFCYIYNLISQNEWISSTKPLAMLEVRSGIYLAVVNKIGYDLSTPFGSISQSSEKPPSPSGESPFLISCFSKCAKTHLFNNVDFRKFSRGDTLGFLLQGGVKGAPEEWGAKGRRENGRGRRIGISHPLFSLKSFSGTLLWDAVLHWHDAAK